MHTNSIVPKNHCRPFPTLPARCSCFSMSPVAASRKCTDQPGIPMTTNRTVKLNHREPHSALPARCSCFSMPRPYVAARREAADPYSQPVTSNTKQQMRPCQTCRTFPAPSVLHCLSLRTLTGCGYERTTHSASVSDWITNGPFASSRNVSPPRRSTSPVPLPVSQSVPLVTRNV